MMLVESYGDLLKSRGSLIQKWCDAYEVAIEFVYVRHDEVWQWVVIQVDRISSNDLSLLV